MSASGRTDPIAGFNFLVEIDGVTRAGFTQVSGLTSEVDVVSYREGGEVGVRQLPGLVKYPRLVLKRGFIARSIVWHWHRAVVNGRIERRGVSVTLLDAARIPVARWNFVEAWPAKWQGPELNAQSSDVLIETLEIVHEGNGLGTVGVRHCGIAIDDQPRRSRKNVCITARHSSSHTPPRTSSR